MPSTTEQLRRDALSIFTAGIAAADPYLAVKNCLAIDGDKLSLLLNDGSKREGHWQKIHLLAFGKAACAMAEAAQAVIPADLLAETSIVITNYENVTAVANIPVIGAGHPLPDAAGFAAAQQLAQYAAAAKAGELVLVLVSGGGSALIPYPATGISLSEKIAVTQLLLASGATINEINCVRKHLSQLKGGGLAKFAAPADLHALILSDVLGDDVTAIASGCTVADDSRYQDAIGLLKSHGIWQQTPETIRQHLEQGANGDLPETPKSADAIFQNNSHTLIGSNAISLAAMQQHSQQLGYTSEIYHHQLCGEARTVAKEWVRFAKSCKNSVALLAGGETTVSLKGTGKGGRNQEMALAFALAAEQENLSGDWVFLSGGTDGRDGPTDAAGGLVDKNSLQRMRTAGCEPLALLANNDSYPALQHAQDHIVIGATGTNVADLQILLIKP